MSNYESPENIIGKIDKTKVSGEVDLEMKGSQIGEEDKQRERKNPRFYREFIERCKCPHCSKHVASIDAPKTQGYCNYKKYEERRDNVYKGPLEGDYQTVKALIEHDHNELSELYGGSYTKLMREKEQLVSRDPLTVEEIREILEADHNADMKMAA